MFGISDNDQNNNVADDITHSDDTSAMDTNSDDSPSDNTSGDNSPPDDNNLIDIKQQALSSLSPLINHLDQTPEEKFKTLMMLIQASDNSHLIKDAYEAANQIGNEKARAQALLDVVNEINYFTQNSDKA
ncbi:MAG TPA: hypothetical protein VHD84_03530 [Candidatus Saccharimonadales bacterium]|nr:hypothetical protein [Candidatus Saccharimonadales bacterium]